MALNTDEIAPEQTRMKSAPFRQKPRVWQLRSVLPDPRSAYESPRPEEGDSCTRLLLLAAMTAQDFTRSASDKSLWNLVPSAYEGCLCLVPKRLFTRTRTELQTERRST